MKTVILLMLISFVLCATEFKDKEYQRIIQIPDDHDGMVTIDLEAEPDMELLDEINRNPANNLYLLFTRRNTNNSQVLVMNNAFSIMASNFNARVPTAVIVHGWLSSQNTNINPVLRKAFLDKGDYNVIVMDWKRLAEADYVTAVIGSPAVGRGLGQFLAFLNRVTGAPFSSMHLVGFSLGAHVVGNAGRELGGKVARVTGLDPAGPLWVHNFKRLRERDGGYVEGIHTNGNSLGIGLAIGDADFFPNGGLIQPGCSTNRCNHNRAWELFASTISYDHLVGKKCANILQVALNTCRGTTLHMGNDILTKNGTGIYRLDTEKKQPF